MNSDETPEHVRNNTPNQAALNMLLPGEWGKRALERGLPLRLRVYHNREGQAACHQ